MPRSSSKKWGGFGKELALGLACPRRRPRVPRASLPSGFGRQPNCAASATLALAILLAPIVCPPARAADLVSQCWPATALQSRPEEKAPQRGAPGHNQRVPAIDLPAATAIPAGQSGAIRRVRLPAGKKLVALTFDLCETSGEIAGYDGAIIDELRRTNSRATFFAGGKWLLTHSERAQQMLADRRFEIASHGWSHRNVRGLTGVALAEEINGPQHAFAEVRKRLAARQCAAGAMQGVAPAIRLFRFPFGACNAQALSAMAASGQLAIQWDVSTGDPDRNQSSAAIVSEALRHVRPGSIVLMHANGRGYNTAAAVPTIVQKLKAQGYELVTVSELLAAGEPEIVQTCYDARPGDTDKYDRLFASSRSDARRGQP